jgi:hypothetical protein
MLPADPGGPGAGHGTSDGLNRAGNSRAMMRAALWRVRWLTRLSDSTCRRPPWYPEAGNPASSQAIAIAAQWPPPSRAASTTSPKPSPCPSSPPTPSSAATWAIGRSRSGSNAITPGLEPPRTTYTT